MSYGVVMCGKCGREVHQDGQNHTWTHCEDKTPICRGFRAVYAGDGEGVGRFCGKDGYVG
jgi:hypothetical protein